MEASSISINDALNILGKTGRYKRYDGCSRTMNDTSLYE